jgi:hypothetical protein
VSRSYWSGQFTAKNRLLPDATWWQK